MKLLLSFFLCLTVVTASYPMPETLIYSQIDQILNHENHTDPALLPCLEVANDFVLGGIFVHEKKDIGNAIFPSPSGRSNWTVEELTNAAKIIINRMQSSKKTGFRVKSYYDDYLLNKQNELTLEELDKALEMYSLPYKVDKSDEFINLHILETLHNLMSEAMEGKFDLRKGTIKLLVPAVDISMWGATELKDAVRKNNVKPALLPYLKAALTGPMYSLDEGKTYCVVTPVGLIPQVDPYYYIPKATKELIQMSRFQSHPLTRRFSKEAFALSSTMSSQFSKHF